MTEMGGGGGGGGGGVAGVRETKTADRNASQPAEEKLPSVLVCEFRGVKKWIYLSFVHGSLS